VQQAERKQDWCVQVATIANLQPATVRGSRWERLATAAGAVAQDLRRLAAHESRLKCKYERAAGYPWLSLEPDPSEPERIPSGARGDPLLARTLGRGMMYQAGKDGLEIRLASSERAHTTRNTYKTSFVARRRVDTVSCFALPFLIVWAFAFIGQMRFYRSIAPAALSRWAEENK
jgi:hypothetical protein